MTFVFGLVGVLVLGLVVVAMGQRWLRPGRRTSGMVDSLGNFIDVLDPAQVTSLSGPMSNSASAVRGVGESNPRPGQDEP
jgi:hypothetical protein